MVRRNRQSFPTQSPLPLRGGRPPFSRVRFTLTLVLSTLVVMSTIGTWWAERQLSGPIEEWGRARATNLATTAINGAIRDVLAGRLEGMEVVEYTLNQAGDVVIGRFNMGPLNQVMSDAVQAILDTFRAQAPEEFYIPLGEITGMRLFAGWGPSVPARIVTTGSVVAEPKIDFKSAGINQVTHRLYVDVTVRMILIAPFMRDDIVVKQAVIVSEEILPGKVPDTYLNLVGYSGDLAGWMSAVEAARASGSASE